MAERKRIKTYREAVEAAAAEIYRVHFENWKRSAQSSSVILRGRMSA
jgi:hypothetical protein